MVDQIIQSTAKTLPLLEDLLEAPRRNYRTFQVLKQVTQQDLQPTTLT